MNICRVQNKDIVTVTICGITLQPDEIYVISDTERQSWIDDRNVNVRISTGALLVGNETMFFTSIADQYAWLSNNNTVKVAIESTTPFADPEYRTECDASSFVVTIPPGESVNIDLPITKDIYVSGGEIIVENPQIGDWLSASVVYGNYVLSTYIKKKWVNTKCFMVFDTKPLIAKLKAGVTLRVTYNACQTEGNRRACINYDMAVKL